MTSTDLSKRLHKRPKYIQGFFTPTNPKKYIGNLTQIYYRSSWELKFMKCLDMNVNVLEWNSEDVVVPYISLVDGKSYKYHVDFFVKYVHPETHEIKVMLVEIKPFKQTQKPVIKQPITEKRHMNYIKECETFLTNVSKWQAVREVADKNGIDFVIVTEKNLNMFSTLFN